MAELDLLSMSLAELANSGPIPPAHQSPNASYTPARVTIEDMVEARASFAEPSVTVSAAVGAATAVAAAAAEAPSHPPRMSSLGGHSVISSLSYDSGPHPDAAAGSSTPPTYLYAVRGML